MAYCTYTRGEGGVHLTHGLVQQLTAGLAAVGPSERPPASSGREVASVLRLRVGGGLGVGLALGLLLLDGGDGAPLARPHGGVERGIVLRPEPLAVLLSQAALLICNTHSQSCSLQLQSNILHKCSNLFVQNIFYNFVTFSLGRSEQSFEKREKKFEQTFVLGCFSIFK